MQKILNIFKVEKRGWETIYKAIHMCVSIVYITYSRIKTEGKYTKIVIVA